MKEGGAWCLALLFVLVLPALRTVGPVPLGEYEWTPQPTDASTSGRIRLVFHNILSPERVGVVESAGDFAVTGTASPVPGAKPVVLGLRVYPNPFNPAANLELSLPRKAAVSIRIFDLRGMLVRSLFTGELEAGIRTFQWDGRTDGGGGAGSGVYHTLVKVGDSSLTKRLMLVK